jgi:D-glycero-alpha-D-manno-heptose 1-phosphate guanylyltransferase
MCPTTHEPRVSVAALLVGGRGERLKVVVKDRPKPMADVGGRPFVERVLRLLRAQDVGRVVFCTAYMAAAIEAHFGDGSRWNMEFAYSREPKLLGTGGAVRHALTHLPSDRFFVLNGDSYCPADMKYLEAEHLARGARATLWCVRVDDCRRYGSVEIDPQGAVRAFKEKMTQKGAGIVNAGVYLLEREVVSGIAEGSVVSLETDFFPSLIGHGLYAVVGDNPLLDIGTPEAYATAEKFFMDNAQL